MRISRGFTLIEVLTVLGLLGVILSIGLIAGFDSLSRSSLVSERDTITLALAGARARALANVNETSHGVRVEEDRLVVFEGDPPANELVTERNPAVEASGDLEITFTPLTVIVDSDKTITLSQNGQEAVIDINTEGRIEW